MIHHTVAHVDCPACELALRTVMLPREFRTLPFRDAAAVWLDARRNKLKLSTVILYQDLLGCLVQFFGDLLLSAVHVGHVNAYQKERQAEIRTTKQHRFAKRGRPDENSDGASRINHEICLLSQVLRRGGAWDEVGKFYEPLPLPKDSPGLALSPAEEQHLFAVARSRPRWMLAYLCDLLMHTTATGPTEIRHLRLRDLVPELRAIDVPEHGAKNEHRLRRIPCNDDAWWAIEQLLARAHQLGAYLPDHFLLPHRAKKRGEAPDPTRPMGSWKRAHYAIRAEAAKTYPRLATLRRYDFRHSAMTKMLEDPAISERTIEEMVGHRLGSKVKERYSHIRMQARRAASEVLSLGQAPALPPKRPPQAATEDVLPVRQVLPILFAIVCTGIQYGGLWDALTDIAA